MVRIKLRNCENSEFEFLRKNNGKNFEVFNTEFHGEGGVRCVIKIEGTEVRVVPHRYTVIEGDLSTEFGNKKGKALPRKNEDENLDTGAKREGQSGRPRPALISPFWEEMLSEKMTTMSDVIIPCDKNLLLGSIESSISLWKRNTDVKGLIDISFYTCILIDLKYEQARFSDFISPYAMMDLAQRLSDGAEKYAQRNWEIGIGYQRFTEGLQRHFLQVCMGDESEDHLSAILFNCMGIVHFHCLNKKELNDMPKYKILEDK